MYSVLGKLCLPRSWRYLVIGKKLYLVFRSTIYQQLILCMVSPCLFTSWGLVVDLNHLLKTVMSPQHAAGFQTVCVWVCFHLFHTVGLLIFAWAHSLNYWLRNGIWQCKPSNFVLLFVLAILGALVLCVNFRISLFPQKYFWDFDWDCIDPIALGTIDIFTIFLSVPWIWYILYLFRHYLSHIRSRRCLETVRVLLVDILLGASFLVCFLCTVCDHHRPFLHVLPSSALSAVLMFLIQVL